MLFGTDGQNRIKAARPGVAGLGGLGCHLAQQLAPRGPPVRPGRRRPRKQPQPQPPGHRLPRRRRPVQDLAERLIRAINPDAEVVNSRHHLPHPEAIGALAGVDLILGGLDNDAARLHLTDLASQHRIVYSDAATDTNADNGPLAYGGRVVTAGTGPGYLFCLDLLDQQQIRRAAMTDEERTADAAIYGVPSVALDDAGPSVVTINGVVASLAATEAVVHLTGLRTPRNSSCSDPATAASGSMSTHRPGRRARTAHDGASPELVLARAYENKLRTGEGEPQTGL